MGDYFADTPHVYLSAASQEQAKTRGNSMFLDDLITPEDQLGIDLADAEVDLIEQLIAIRKQRGLSQAQVAESMGVDRSAVTRFEKAIFGAKRPNITTVRRYATAVNAYIAPIVTQAENYSQLQSALRRNLKRLQETDK